MTVAIAADLLKVLERIDGETEQLAAALRPAQDRFQQMQATAEECAGRITAIDSEVHQLREIAAQQLLANGVLDMTALHRLESSRRELVSELPIHTRAAAMARAKLEEAQRNLSASRAERTYAMTAAGRRVIR